MKYYVCLKCGKSFEVTNEDGTEPFLKCPFSSCDNDYCAIRCDDWNQKHDLIYAVEKVKENTGIINDIRNKRLNEAAQLDDQEAAND